MEKGNLRALAPIGVFLVLYLGLGILFEYILKIEMGFYSIPIVVIFLVALLVACFQNRKLSFDDKLAIMGRGIGDKTIVTMILIFMAAGIFVGTVGRNSAESVAYLMLSFIPPEFAVAVLFVVSCFVSLAMGTSVGTITLITPISVAVSAASGFDLPLCVASVMGGAMFGDNLSMISDTTIAATRTQGVELKDKFRTNFWCALPAAIIALVLLVVFGRPEHAVIIPAGNYELIKVVPYMLVLVLALLGINVFLVLLFGIVSAGVIGIMCGDLTVITFATNVWEGYKSMIEVFLLSMFGGGVAELTAKYGGLQWMIEKLSGICKGKKSAQAALCVLAGVTDMATANNTVAIIVDGNMARSISEKYKIDPRKTASILDAFTCIFQGMIPYGAQFLLVASLTKGRVSPLDIIPLLWYLFLLGLFTVLSFLIPSYEKLTLSGEWDWENHTVIR